MSTNRVQKLLFSEYCDFEDMVLIESPFAQTTKKGIGIRQVHLGLTPSKLVMATDVLPPVEYVNFNYTPGIDPEIETFELIAIYPVECVNLSIYKKRKTQALKARFCNNKVLYFELGGFEKRAMFWRLWCERVKFLCPGDSGSSRSETSVGTSSTGSTLYLLEKKMVAKNGLKQLWCKFGPNSVFNNSDKLLTRNKWTDRNLYLGKNFDNNTDYIPIMSHPNLDDFIKRPETSSNKIIFKMHRPEKPSYFEENDLSFGDTVAINRFGSGVNEGCNTALYLTVDDYVIPKRYSQIFNGDKPNINISSLENIDLIAESALLLWELYRGTDPNKYKIRHKRRYGLAPKPLFMYGLNAGKSSPASKFSLLFKRTVSETNITPDYNKSEFGSTLSKNLLVTSPSQQYSNSEETSRCNDIINAPKSPVVLFWTPKYKYRPKSSRNLFQERCELLRAISDYHEMSTKPKRMLCGRKCFKRKSTKRAVEQKDSDEDSVDEPHCKKKRKRKNSFIYNMFSSRVEDFQDIERKRQPHETYLHFMKRILKQDVEITIWKFDSTTLAEQLTIVDKNLFMKISLTELEKIQRTGNIKNAPNVQTMLIFCQRASCLVASEILRVETERNRARLMARLINVAHKCHNMANMHSCKSVLVGLQSPAIYRLRETWAYIRKKHASKYESFEHLCRFYKDPRLPSYQRTLNILTQSTPYLPYLGDILAKLLGRVPHYQFEQVSSSSPSLETVLSTKTFSSEEEIKRTSTIFTKFFRVFAAPEVTVTPDDEVICASPRKLRKNTTINTKTIKFKGLYEYYSLVGYLEDHRIYALKETKMLLEKGQLAAMGYNFKENEEAKSYILKARYDEDEANFYKSLGLESPVNFYECRNK